MAKVLYFQPEVYLSKNTKQKVSDVRNRRIASILTPKEVCEKVKNGKIFKSDTEKMIYVYHDKSGICPESFLQFYDSDGYLLWTYPWNGKISINNSLVYPFYDMAKKINELQITFTESGRVAIRDMSTNYHYDRGATKETDITVFDWNGKKLSFCYLYGKDSAKDTDLREKSGVFGVISTRGDSYVDKHLAKSKERVAEKSREL